MTTRTRPLLNEALLVARKYWGFTQADLAERMGVSQAMVSDIERGTKSVSMEMLDRYSKALGVRRSQLMFFAEEIEGQPAARKGKTVIAEKTLALLKRLKPVSAEDA